MAVTLKFKFANNIHILYDRSCRFVDLYVFADVLSQILEKQQKLLLKTFASLSHMD